MGLRSVPHVRECLQSRYPFSLRQAMFVSAPTRRFRTCLNGDALNHSGAQLERSMYIGGGLLGTLLVIALIVYLLRRT
jgi:hypothetical protein